MLATRTNAFVYIFSMVITRVTAYFIVGFRSGSKLILASTAYKRMLFSY